MPERPNIILIITDQQRMDTIQALGNSHMETPNLDRLVREGVSFSNCHITAPSCVPSRASLFKGYYPHTTGVFKNGDSWRHSWVEDLAAAGYSCINIGKMHTYPLDTPAGFHERYVVENKDRFLIDRFYFDEWDKACHARGLVKQQRELYRQRSDYRERMGAFEWELPEDMHSDCFVGDLAKWWIGTKPVPQGPLFLQIGFPGPHPPFDPIPRYAESYLKKDLPLPQLDEEDLNNQPPAFKGMRVHNQEVDHDSVVHLPEPTREQLHRQRAYYYANVTMIDEKIGEIMDALEARGYLENSVVVFMSDHGEMLNDHGHIQKWTAYDEVTRVPAIVWAPGRFQGDRTIDGLCQHMDLGPTLLDLAEVPYPDSMEARSLLPALQGEAWSPRPYVFAEHCRDGNLTETEFMTMIRSEDWKLVHFLDEPYGQLFDLKNDPREMRNLWDEPSAATRKSQLLHALQEWRIRSSYHTTDWAQDWR